MYAHVSKEEWLFRGLAIAICLAMVGMAVMPLAVGDATAVYSYIANRNLNPYAASGGLIIGFGLIKASDILYLAELAGVASAGVGAAALVAAGIGVLA